MKFSLPRTVDQELLLRGQLSDAWCATRHQILPQDMLVEDVYPLYADRASGQFLWDVDGNRYIDFILGFGTVVLGHANELVTDALVEELRKGVNLSPLWRPAQVELTEELVKCIPGSEMAFLMRTGSDATSGCLRLARLFTKRTRAIRWGYNGWHDWSCSRPEGVPASILDDISSFRFNDLDSLRFCLERNDNDTACVIMMPFETECVHDGFLHEARELVHEHGALFILDEMRSGFRMALGGAQEFFGIKADLATYSKAMANGYAISAIVGRADVLECLGQTHMASTYYANSAEMKAALKTIEILKNTDAISRIWTLGARLQQGLTGLIAEFGASARVSGYPPAPFMSFESDNPARDAIVRDRFYSETLRHGVFFHPNHHWFVSAAHTEGDIDAALSACRSGFEVLNA